MTGASEGKWVPAQGDAVARILRRLHLGSDVSFERIYVLSPFRDVVGPCRGLVRRKFRDAPEDFLNDHIGTVHTMQGKEADVVLFVLGLADGHQRMLLAGGSTLRVGVAGEDTLLLDVRDDRGGGAEVGVLVQDRQVMVQCGGHNQVIRHGEPVMLALGGEPGLDAVHGFPRTIGHWYPGVGLQQIRPDAFVLGCPGDRQRFGENGVADGHLAVRDLLMPGLVYLTAQDSHQSAGVDQVPH